jgi:hypothetical protein
MLGDLGSGAPAPLQEGYLIMKVSYSYHSWPALVSATAAPPPADPEIDHQIAEGVQALQTLPQWFDNELFSI